MHYRLCYSVTNKGDFYPTLAHALYAKEKDDKVFTSFANYLSMEGRMDSVDDLIGDLKRMERSTGQYIITKIGGSVQEKAETLTYLDFNDVLAWIVSHFEELWFSDIHVYYSLDATEYVVHCESGRHEMDDPPKWKRIHIVAQY